LALPQVRAHFVTPDMSHSCRRMRVANHLDGRPPSIVGLYRHIHDLVRQIGPVTADPQGSGIVFQVRARSIGVTTRERWVDLTLWLKGGQTHPAVRKVDDYGVLGRVLHFRLTDEEDIDAELVKLLRDAYRVGAQDVDAPATRVSRARPEG
jgi:hypothetical protein